MDPYSGIWATSKSSRYSWKLSSTIYFAVFWKLPRHCHTGILHQIAGVSSIYNRISKTFSSFLSKAISLDCPLISKCFNSTSMLVCTACGYKSIYIKHYSEDELVCADFVRDIRLGRIIIVFDSVDTTYYYLSLL